MNIPPTSFVAVPAPDLQAFAARLGRAAGLSESRSDLLAELLTANDLRGVFSHGTSQLATYARLVRDGVLNGEASPSVVSETPASLLMDGEGGLGYFAAYDGTRRLIEKVRETGVAVLVTRNHGHFGAAGLYARMTLEHDLLCFVTSGHQLQLEPGNPVYAAAGGSPMSFSAPTDREPPMVLDFGAMHDLYDDSPHRTEIARLAPGIVHRSIGLGAVCQSWGGFLAGVPLDSEGGDRDYAGANQGSMVIALRIDLFMPPEQFKAEMDAYVRAVHQLEGISPGQPSFLPGGIEAEQETAARRDGIPVGELHQELLETVAAEFGVDVPWGMPGQPMPG